MPRYLILFLILLLYVVAQFIWWGYHIYDLHAELLAVEIGDGVDYKAAVNQRLWMILGEGGVFLLVLFLGAGMIFRSIKKEKELLKRQTNFMLSVTHEFNSPLASIKLVLDTIEKRDIQGEKKTKLIAQASAQVDRLSSLVGNILQSSRNESATLSNGKVQLHTIIPDILAKVGSSRITVDKVPKVEFEFKENEFEVILTNLLQNALNHTSGKVSLKFNPCVDLLIVVEDEGPGIPETEQQKIFKQFYRIGDETIRATRGAGLGLYLSQNMAKSNNAEVSVKNNAEAGASFTLTIKKYNEK